MPTAIEDLIERGSAIAVVGMSGKFPGAKNLAEYWRNLSAGTESISTFSVEELQSLGVPPKLARHPNYVKASGYVADRDLFDASFFAISAKEAEGMDPQQRLLLECAWTALEDAGCDPERFAGLIGLYVGIGLNRHWLVDLAGSFGTQDPAETYQTFIANEKDFAATRVSYKLNLKGPSVVVQTACSTSLVAIHTACQSLLHGECDAALAGGVSLSRFSEAGYLYQEGMILSADGHCRAFDAKAGGTVPGGGVGIVVLKRLADAIAAGDTIRAVVLGSAINNDGSEKVGYTAPSMEGQARALSEALAVGGVDPRSVSYIETHGTGTPLGDPIEVAALSKAYGVAPRSSCALGSVKTNIGHADVAAGVAGFIKTVLSLQHRALAPTLHFEIPNPKLDLAGGRFYVNTELKPWDNGGNPLRAGVSSFGIGGTNAHVVLEEPPRNAAAKTASRHELLTLSAATPAALDASRRDLALHLKTTKHDLSDVAWTLSAGRKPLRWRCAVVAADAVDAADALERGDPQRIFTGERGDERTPIAFLFPGQGAQHPNMALGLYEAEPFFKARVDECLDLLKPSLPADLRSILYPKSDVAAEEAARRLGETRYSQPALFIVEYALARLWMEWGLRPYALAGHSIGEYAAACLAGVFSLPDALRLVAKRGELMQQLAPGAMLSVPLPEAQLLERIGTELSLAAVNGPSQCVASGPEDAIARLQESLKRDGIPCKRLQVSHAFHSAMTDPALPDFRRFVSAIKTSPPKTPWVSNVTGTWITEVEAMDPEYWVRHLRRTVRFADGLSELKKGRHILLEVGPGRTLGTLARLQEGSEPAGLILSSLASPSRGEPDRACVLNAVGRLWAAGAPVEPERLHEKGGRRVPLPTYPFEGKRFHARKSVRRDPREDKARHPLLGESRESASSKEWTWEASIDRRSPSYLEDHQARGIIVLPGTAYIEMALAAAREAMGEDSLALEDVRFQQALILEEGRSERVQTTLSRDEAGNGSFQIFSSSTGPNGDRSSWTLHAAGKIRRDGSREGRPEPASLSDIQDRCSQTVSGEEHYRLREQAGFHYGPRFQRIDRIWSRSGEALSLIRIGEDIASESDHYRLHPILLDACVQAAVRALSKDGAEASGSTVYMPVGFTRMEIYELPSSDTIWSHVVIRPEGSADAKTHEADIRLLNPQGRVLARLTGWQLRAVKIKAARQDLRYLDWVFEVAWKPQSRIEASSTTTGGWLILADRQGLGEKVRSLLEARGENCSRLTFQGEDYEAILREGTWRGVVHLWNLDAQEPCGSDGCQGLLRLSQALSRSEGPAWPRLWIVTRGAQDAGDIRNDISAAQAPAWGLGRTIMQELPGLRCSLIDIGELADAKSLVQELTTGGSENQVALRGERRYVARLRRRPWPKPPDGAPPLLRGDATYLITGGLGALGLQTARWLSDNGARHLVLLGRNSPSTEAGKALEALRGEGTEVSSFQTDVCDREQLRGIFERIRSSMPPLKGILHAAGILDDGILAEMEPRRFESVLAPKALGAWNIHSLCGDDSLDFFVMFSSISSIIGTPGQGNYSAANAFLDALALSIRRKGGKAYSIGWGPWAGDGMAARSARNRRRQESLFDSIPPETALDFLGLMLGQEEVAQAALMPLRAAPATDPSRSRWEQPIFFDCMSEINAKFGRTASAAAGAKEERLAGRLRESSPEERGELIRAYLRRKVEENSRGTGPFKDESDLTELGWDSLLLLQLSGHIQRDLEIAAKPAEILKGPSICAIEAYLSAQFPSAPPSAAARPAPGKGTPWLPFHRPNPNALLRLFCFPYAGGAAQAYRHWQKSVPERVQICAVQPPGRWDRIHESPYNRIQPLVLAATDALAPLLDGPFAFYGHSFGSTIAFEVAKELRRRGLPLPAHLFVSSMDAPQILARFISSFPSPEGLSQAEFLGMFGGSIPREIQNDEELLKLVYPALKADLEMFKAYSYSAEPALPCGINAFGGKGDLSHPRSAVERWREQTTGSFDLEMFEGGHFFIQESAPFLKALSSHLETALDSLMTASMSQ